MSSCQLPTLRSLPCGNSVNSGTKMRQITLQISFVAVETRGLTFNDTFRLVMCEVADEICDGRWWQSAHVGAPSPAAPASSSVVGSRASDRGDRAQRRDGFWQRAGAKRARPCACEVAGGAPTIASPGDRGAAPIARVTDPAISWPTHDLLCGQSYAAVRQSVPASEISSASLCGTPALRAPNTDLRTRAPLSPPMREGSCGERDSGFPDSASRKETGAFDIALNLRNHSSQALFQSVHSGAHCGITSTMAGDTDGTTLFHDARPQL